LIFISQARTVSLRRVCVFLIHKFTLWLRKLTNVHRINIVTLDSKPAVAPDSKSAAVAVAVAVAEQRLLAPGSKLAAGPGSKLAAGPGSKLAAGPGSKLAAGPDNKPAEPLPDSYYNSHCCSGCDASWPGRWIENR
jgi:hypothetical protein